MKTTFLLKFNYSGSVQILGTAPSLYGRLFLGLTIYIVILFYCHSGSFQYIPHQIFQDIHYVFLFFKQYPNLGVMTGKCKTLREGEIRSFLCKFETSFVGLRFQSVFNASSRH